MKVELGTSGKGGRWNSKRKKSTLKRKTTPRGLDMGGIKRRKKRPEGERGGVGM